MIFIRYLWKLHIDKEFIHQQNYQTLEISFNLIVRNTFAYIFVSDSNEPSISNSQTHEQMLYFP